MFTAMRARTQQLACVSAFYGALVALWLAQGCYQPPAPSNVADFTSTPTAAPGTAQETGSMTSGNTTVPTSTDVPSTGPAQNVGSMTLSPASNPFICLGVKEVAAGAPIILTSCTGSSLQKWLLSKTRLEAAPNLCLSFPATGTAALKTTPVLSACDMNDISQMVMRGSSGGLAMNSYGANYGLAAQVPTASNSNITFDNLDGSLLGQKWILGADSAQAGTLQKGGFRITPSNSNAQCLTAGTNAVSYGACSAAQQQNQLFRWNEAAQITISGNCLAAVASGPCKLAPCDGQDPNQRWSSISGKLVVSSGLGCLNVTDGSVASCPTDATLNFVFGAQGAL